MRPLPPTSTAAPCRTATPSGASRPRSIDWQQPPQPDLRLLPPAVCEVVRRRHHQPVPQRGGPPRRHAPAAQRARSGSPPRWTRRWSTPSPSCSAEVERMAAILQSLGVKQGDRVLVYMPMIPEAAFAMLACARIGALHSVVFGGFASVSAGQPHRRRRAHRRRQRRRRLARRQGGALQGPAGRGHPAVHAQARARADGGPRPATMPMVAGRDADCASLRAQAPGRPGALRLGGVHPPELHAVHQRHHRQAQGRAARHWRLRGGAGREHEERLPAASPARPTSPPSDIGWVVGHSYIVYGPLIAGMATILYEGLPTRPDAAVWWSIVGEVQASPRCSAPPRPCACSRSRTRPALRASRPELPARALPGRRAAGRAHRASWIADALGQAHHRQLLADRDAAGRSCRCATASRPAPAVRLARQGRCTATT
jgi:hypothetical protein